MVCAAIGKSPFAAWAHSAADRQRAAERPDKGVAQQAELVAHGARPPNYGSAASHYVADATCRVHFAGLARVWWHGSAARAVAAALGASSSPKARSRAPSKRQGEGEKWRWTRDGSPKGFVRLPAWVIYLRYVHFGAMNTGELVGGVIAKGGQEAQGGWVVPRTRPNPRSTPKSFACGAKPFIGLQDPPPLLLIFT